MKTRIIIVMLMMMLSSGFSVKADTYWDYGAAPDNSWFNATNWNPDGVPGAATQVRIGTTTDPVQISGPGAVGNNVYVADLSSDQTVLNVSNTGSLTASAMIFAGLQGNGTINSSGTLTANGFAIVVGQAPTANGTLRINGGTVTSNFMYAGDWGSGLVELNTGGNINLGGLMIIGGNSGAVGTVNINGGNSISQMVFMGDQGSGALNVADGEIATIGGMVLAGWASATGVLNVTGGHVNIGDFLFVGDKGAGDASLDGGVLTANWLQINALSHMDITNGLLELRGDHLSDAALLGYMNNGFLTAYGQSGSQYFNMTYDGNITSITAIPEPASMMLLGIGLLVLRAKKNRK